jgi:transposase
MDKFEAPQIQAELLHSLPKEVQEYILTLQKLVESLVTQNQELSIQITQNSQNSSKPPSSDPPFKRPPKKTKEKSSRPKGGQVGHSRHLRELLPVEAVDEIVEIYPHECDRCHSILRPSDQTGEPLRHQVWELPQVKASLTEYQFYSRACSQCLYLTKSESEKHWPKDVPTGQFGPRLVATLGVLHGQYQLSLRQTQELALDLWQLPLSLGGVATSCRKASTALAASYQSIEGRVQDHPTSHVDETGWKREGKLRWLWVATNAVASLFKIRRSRDRQSLKELLGENYAGIIHSDRHKPYLKLAESQHQLCWAHLIRNLRGLSQRAGPAEKWASLCLDESEKLFAVWHRFKDEQISRSQLIDLVEPIRATFKSQLKAGTTLGDGSVRSFSRELLKLEERLYHFVKKPGIEPTNNAAEQALRCAVIWRKKCFGSQSDWGERFVERILSVKATVQKQGSNFLNYLTGCLEAEWFKTPTPTLFATP